MKSFKVPNLIILTTVFFAAGAPASRALPALTASLPSTLQFTLIAGGLTAPVFVTNAGDGSHRLFIVQQTGQIRIYKNGSLLPNPFLNISGSVSNFTGINSEQGLLALAFDPNYRMSGIFYITYTTNTGVPTYIYSTTLARYHVSSNADVADPSSGTVLLSIPKKFTNHNGGMLAFGPDGYLYMSMGDGGSGGDPDGNAQNLHSMLGKMLRLDVSSTPPAGQKYVIPATNPFFGGGDPNVKQEIWAYGLRNPWRFSFDRSTGNLLIADVGQDVEEEIDFQPNAAVGGQNYGWHILEGNLCYNPATGCVAPPAYSAPVATYDHGNNDSYGCAVIGGSVYRGVASPSLQGVYLYGDYCSGKVFGLVRNFDSTWTYGLIVSTTYNISSFGQDEDGEPYLTDYGAGKLYRISANLGSNPGAPVIVQLYPPDGNQVCPRPPVGAYFLNVVPPGRAFDPSTITLTLDGADVTSSAEIIRPITSPTGSATVLFTPSSDLALGNHQAIAAYNSALGTTSRLWQFTVANIACSTTLQQSPAGANAARSVPMGTPGDMPATTAAMASASATTDTPAATAASASALATTDTPAPIDAAATTAASASASEATARPTQSAAPAIDSSLRESRAPSKAPTFRRGNYRNLLRPV